MTKEEKDMATQLQQKYAHLKEKLAEINKNVPILKGENGMIELDPKNPHHQEWFEKDLYKGE